MFLSSVNFFLNIVFLFGFDFVLLSAFLSASLIIMVFVVRMLFFGVCFFIPLLIPPALILGSVLVPGLESTDHALNLSFLWLSLFGLLQILFDDMLGLPMQLTGGVLNRIADGIRVQGVQDLGIDGLGSQHRHESPSQVQAVVLKLDIEMALRQLLHWFEHRKLHLLSLPAKH